VQQKVITEAKNLIIDSNRCLHRATSSPYNKLA
jgi:hypothetical protein